MEQNLIAIFIVIASFGVIFLASKQVGQFFMRGKLPLISGFLFTGIIAGPYVLGLIPAEAVEKLRFVDEISLAFIAFAAGSELYLKEFRDRFKSIAWVTAGQVVFTFHLSALSIFLLANYIPFMRLMPVYAKLAVSLLGGAILVARSPSSAIAIVTELRARGPFTRTALGVTVIIDVVVIVLFSINSSVADALLTNLPFNLAFILVLMAELALAALGGYLLSKLLLLIVSSRLAHNIKIALVLGSGYGIFAVTESIRHLSHQYLSFELFLEPLLICMVGSFILVNYSNYRADFLRIMHNVGPPVYVAFFTLTGASLAMDILVKTWPIALVLFFVRLAAIFVGSFSGGVVAGDPLKHNRVSWMVYVTQAGVGLGLAKEVAGEFPDWGAAFATIIISVIVLNQIVGPPLFKWAINHVGEAHPRAETPQFDGVRDAIIFGLEDQSLALARLLSNNGWQVKVASPEIRHTEEIENACVRILPISDLSLNTLRQLKTENAEAVVTMLSDDENYRICELIYEHFGVENLVVRLNDMANFERFHELGALIVDPGTAIVSLLDQMVRSPVATSLLLGMDEEQTIVDIELRNPNLHGAALRDLRLPLDTLIQSVQRDGNMIISHGYTRLALGDRMTVVGSRKSLEEVMRRFNL